jgi:type II secretory pathway pseudopilin PulG
MSQDPHPSGEHIGLIAAITDPPLGVSGKVLKLLRDIMFAAIVLLALVIGYVQSRRTAELAIESQQRLVCAARYQDRVDSSTARVTTTIGEIVVIITTEPPEKRGEAVDSKITELAQANIDVRKALADKSDYNDAGRPLPCPIST